MPRNYCRRHEGANKKKEWAEIITRPHQKRQKHLYSDSDKLAKPENRLITSANLISTKTEEVNKNRELDGDMYQDQIDKTSDLQ